MKKVTEIKEAAKSSLFNIFIDDEFALSLSAKGIYETGISVGRLLSESEYEAVREYERGEKAYSHAVYLLGFRDYSEKELLDRLAEKGIDGTEAVARLVSLGYVDDDKFARKLAEKYSKNYGKRRVEEELRKHKIPKDIWQNVTDEFCCDMSDAAYVLLCSKQKGKPFSDRKERDRVYAFLIRRGYGHDEIKKAFDKYNENTGEEYTDE